MRKALLALFALIALSLPTSVSAQVPACSYSTTTGASCSGQTALAFNASATASNWNPDGRSHASSIYASTVTITPPSTPYLLRVRGTVSVNSTSNPNYYGLLVSSDATHFAGVWVDVNGTGGISMTECTVSACTASIGTFPFPGSGSQTTGEVFYVDMYFTVTSSSLYMAGMAIDGASVPQNSSPNLPYQILGTAVNFTNPITVYALGHAATDVVSSSYSLGF